MGQESHKKVSTCFTFHDSPPSNLILP